MDNNEISQPHKTGPGFFYGYIVVIVAFLILVVSFSLHSTYGLFFTPMLAELGWTRAMTSGAFSLSMIIYGVLGIVTGGLADKLGPRVVMTLCGVLLGLGCLLMSQVNTLWQLYLFYGVIVGIGLSGVWVPQLSCVARWFVKRRSLMTGIVIAGAGISQLVAPPVISRLIANYDWRLSYVILGVVVLLSTVLAAQFLRRDPSQMGQRPYGEDEGQQQELKSETKDFSFKESVYTAQFWIASIIFLCYGFGFSAVLVHIVPYAIDLEISAVTAANILAVMGGISILGSYVLGGVADRIGNRHVYIIGSALTAAALFWLVPAREEWALYLFAVAFGFAFGGMGAAESPLIARLFGVNSHGLIYGVIHIGFTVGSALGPYLTGYIFDITGTYQVAFLLCAALAITSLIIAAVLRPTRRLGGRI